MKAKQIISEAINKTIESLGFVSGGYIVEHPAEKKNGEYATNVALSAQMLQTSKTYYSPYEIAIDIKNRLDDDVSLKNIVEKTEIAGPGFINFYLSDSYLVKEVNEVIEKKDGYGKNQEWQNQKVMVEYTDPNPFKQFHIGHLMSNTIGESLSRLIEFSGAEVKRVCYQGDVGMHVAKSIWGLRELLKEKNQTIEDIEKLDLDERAEFLGKGYALGATEFGESEKVKEEINALNMIIYERSDKEIQKVYDLGRKWSLEYFETIYEKLGTKFDDYFFESEAGSRGLELVNEHMSDGVFEKSEGAVVFKGEKYGLHTRVFVNSLGLPTYEAKELGLAKTKYERYPYDKSVVVTGNEINAYFKVLLKAMSLIYLDLAAKQTHIGHGMLNLKSGKMSSRTGNVVTGESLLFEVGDEIKKKMEESGKIKEIESVDRVVNAVSVGAIKYSMLKQSPGKNIVFDFDTSLSFEGDSGPYLQYAFARAMSVLRKSKSESGEMMVGRIVDEEKDLLRWICRFEEVVSLAVKDMAPNFVCGYLIELASRFNHFYAECKIVGDKREGERLALTRTTAQILKNGLWLLGIETVEKM